MSAPQRRTVRRSRRCASPDQSSQPHDQLARHEKTQGFLWRCCCNNLSRALKPINQFLGVSTSQPTEWTLERDKAERTELLERNRALRIRWREAEADSAARLEQINMVKEAEADHATLRKQIDVLTDRLKESEADRAARLKVIEALTDP